MMGRDEKLVRRFLLSAGDGAPQEMHLILSPSFPCRRIVIRNLAKAIRRQPGLLAKLPGPETLPFFREEAGSDAWKQLREEDNKNRVEAAWFGFRVAVQFGDAYSKALSEAIPNLKAEAAGDPARFNVLLEQWSKAYMAAHGGDGGQQ